MSDFQAVLIIILGLIFIFLATSLRLIPHNSFAVISVLGRRTKKIKQEGIRLIPCYHLICDTTVINKKNREYSVITPPPKAVA